MASNTFEIEARRRKVARLVRHITELFEMLNMHPERDGQLMADLLRGWGDAEWTQAAIHVGSPGASVTTRLAVLAYFQGAQRKAAS
jgi:hypothetical protein